MNALTSFAPFGRFCCARGSGPRAESQAPYCFPVLPAPVLGASRPLLIGLTGNIGTGKSTVAGMLAELGAETIDADEVAHEVTRAGTSAHAAVVETFGPEVLAADGEIDRKRLGALVFADPTALARLEVIVHPATLEAIQRRLGATSADACDSVWVTTCRPEQQVYRIIGGRGLSRTEAEQRVRAQPPQEEKIARADVVIDTSGSLSRTRARVQTAWEWLTREGGRKR